MAAALHTPLSLSLLLREITTILAIIAPHTPAPPTLSPQELAAGDDDAFSDPFPEIRIKDVEARLPHADGTCAPRWYKTVTLDVDLPLDLDLAPLVHIMMWDYDRYVGWR